MNTITVLDPTVAEVQPRSLPIAVRPIIESGGKVAFWNNGKPHADALLREIKDRLSVLYNIQDSLWIDRPRRQHNSSVDLPESQYADFEESFYQKIRASGAQGVVVAVGD